MREPTDGDSRPRFRPSFAPVEAKFHPPAPRPGTVPRPRLIGRLTAEPIPPIVSVVAPPGYGKTLLLAELAASETQPVAWLTLDRHDNDPSVFLAYLAMAIDRVRPIDPALRGALAAPGERVLGTAVPRLASELHLWGRPGLVILDDVHRLVDRTCLDALTEILEHLPPGLQVAMAARMEPGLPFGRFRAQRGLREIGQTDLALDRHETEALAAAVGRRLTPTEAGALAERTEGWAAAIYLATLARERGDSRITNVGGISGPDRYIAEYLRSELGTELGDEDLRFLTRTAILETVQPEVAEVLTGTAGATERLRALARANLLIGVINTPDATYRYHHLLREFLRAELERLEPGEAPELHRRAAAWFSTSGRTDLAVEHTLASGDVDAAARLVTAAALPMFYEGHVGTLVRWLGSFDDAALARHPPLAVIAGWIHLLAGNPAAADHAADVAERSTYDGAPPDGSASFESSRAMLRAVMARHGLDDVLANARIAASSERAGDPWRSNAIWLLGSARLLEGDVEAAEAAFAEAAEAAEASGATAMVALAKRASLALGRGDWTAAERFSRDAHGLLAKAGFQEIVAALLVYAVMARVAIQLGDPGGARDALVQAQAVRPLASYGLPWFTVDALLELARAYLASSDPAGARSVIREAEDVVRRRPDLGILTTELADVRRRVGAAASTLVGSSSLTAAELRLLPILSTYLSFQDIGERLHISRNTVKTEALSIYGKLQVSSRGEAVERAVEIGLLEPFPGLALTRSR